MRASRQEQTGGAGASEVQAAFQRLGWGVVENTRHDLGTDLFVLARDQRLFDLGLVVGVQVKAGDSYFQEPMHDPDGRLLGWWFRDHDRAHVDAWLSHVLPHLIVLHDLNTRTSYWAHVTADAVVGTGAGAKLLVPKANTIDEEHREALLQVAATPRPKVAWERSAWTGAASLAPRDLLRHALVTPRLVAPHPNADYRTPLTPQQAVALLVQARTEDVERFAKEHPEVPSLAEAARSAHWLWRFVGALGHRLITGEVDGLLGMVDQAPGPAARAAATVTAAAGLLEEARADEAIVLLEQTLARDEAEPVDHAWLRVQHAQACAEIGRMDQARATALDVHKIQVTHPDDVTATAIAGVAAMLLFDTSAWGRRREPPVAEGDLAELISGMDTAAALWRTQTMAGGLTAQAKRMFDAWAQDTTVRLGGSDVAGDRLLAATLIAGHVGDHSGWRRMSSLLGQDRLLRLGHDADPQAACQGLDALRLAGDTRALKLAVRRLATNGPATTVTLAATDVRLEASTHTTGPTNLALLQHGGDLLDEVTADRSVHWLLTTLEDPSAFRTRTTPSYQLHARLVDTLAAVAPAASPTGRHAIVAQLIALTPQHDQLLATAWAQVVRALPEQVWAQETAGRIGQHAGLHHDQLRLPLLGVAARYDPSVTAQLVAEVRGGSLGALAALGSVRTLPTEVAANLIGALAEQADRQVRKAQAGSFALGEYDVGRTLALLNVWHPSVACWDPLLSLLENPAVAAAHKRDALQVLASLAGHLDQDLRARLAAISVAVATGPTPTDHLLLFGGGDVSGVAANLAAALGALDDDATDHQLLTLLAGNPKDRQWAARVASRRSRLEDIGVLVALTQDPEPGVRAAAAAQLAVLVATERGGAIAIQRLQGCLGDPGTQVPASVAATLAHMATRSPVAQEVLTRLCNHASAYVRMTATSAIDQ